MLSRKLTKIKTDLYRGWIDFARSSRHVLVLLIVILSIASTTPDVQKQAYGVLGVSTALTWASWALYKAFKNHPDSRPVNYGSAAYRRYRWIIVTMAFFLPIIVSWQKNETLYGAINPIGYWKEQLSNTTERD